MKYLNSQFVKTTPISVNRNPLVLMVDLDPPEEVREQLTVNELASMSGLLAMTFYCEPVPGDVISYGGHLWRVSHRLIKPNVYRRHGDRYIPTVKLEYLGQEPTNQPSGNDAKDETDD